MSNPKKKKAIDEGQGNASADPKSKAKKTAAAASNAANAGNNNEAKKGRK